MKRKFQYSIEDQSCYPQNATKKKLATKVKKELTLLKTQNKVGNIKCVQHSLTVSFFFSDFCNSFTADNFHNVFLAFCFIFVIDFRILLFIWLSSRTKFVCFVSNFVASKGKSSGILAYIEMSHGKICDYCNDNKSLSGTCMHIARSW